MNPSVWVGLGFCATSENSHPDQYAQWGPIRMVAPQLCWGQHYPNIDPDLRHGRRVVDDCRKFGLVPSGWGWCDGPDAGAADAEARFHARTALELGLTTWIANCEEKYDGHGNSGDPKYQLANVYAAAFREVASEAQLELGLTTTPRWASDGTGMRAAGATIMPQCFVGEVTSGDAEIRNSVPFMESWGWPRDRQRPLVQTYATGGVVPDPHHYNEEAAAYQVGVVPYTLEQGSAQTIQTLAPSISRLPLPPESPPIDTEDKPIEGGGPPPLDLPFARALYPPDCKDRDPSKTPSPPGPDVEGVKRALSRAGGGAGPPDGYWKWQAFSPEFTNGFSHGSSSSTGGRGVAGYQQDWLAVEPTGWYGKASHESLVGHRIRDGLAHAGEWAFDDRAVELYRQALSG